MIRTCEHGATIVIYRDFFCPLCVAELKAKDLEKKIEEQNENFIYELKEAADNA